MKSTLKRGVRRLAVLEVLKKPMTVTEIKHAVIARLGLSKETSISATLHQLENTGYIKCLTPLAKEGKVYALTSRGKEARQSLVHNHFEIVNPKKDIDWDLHGYVACGRQRKAVLKAMSKEPMRASQILRIAQNFNETVSRPNLYDILRCFTEKGIVKVTSLPSKKKKKRWVWFSLTEKGLAIKEILLS